MMALLGGLRAIGQTCTYGGRSSRSIPDDLKVNPQ